MDVPEKKKGGRQPHRPSVEQRHTVSIMAAVGIVHDEIALALGISDETLRKYYSEELATGRVKTITRVADSLVRQALAGNMTAAIFYLKTQAGWRDVNTHEVTGRDGGPIESRVIDDADRFTSSIAGLVARTSEESGA